jgi:hypothetical protein
VIQDVDDTLKALLVQKVPIDTSAIDIKFEMPTHDWSSKLSKPTINAYLYDIRENVELRSNERYLTQNGHVGTLQQAPVRIDLSYFISAWTTDISDEHQLLGQILVALLRFPLLPDDVLQGSMQTQPLPLQAWIARPERMPNPWDFWGHVENRMKSALNYIITGSFSPNAAEEVKLVATTVINVTQKSVLKTEASS